MATEEQVQKLITLVETQMTALTNLSEENAKLRVEVATATAATPQTSKSRSKRPDRPLINAGIDDREWELIREAWTRYKLMCEIDDDDVYKIRLELRASCSAEVNQFLFEYVGTATLNVATEEELLSHIKSVAVKTVHKEVHTLAFNAMKQEKGESITHFVGQLRSKAFLCGFEVECTSHTPPIKLSYAEKMIEQRLVAGLYNPEHQRRILSEAAALTTLDAKVKRLQVLEATEESAALLNPTPPSSAAASRSAYKQTKSRPSEEAESAPKCRNCGHPSHPGSKPIKDRRSCPARGKTCLKCKKKGHFSTVCESEAAEVATASGEPESEEVCLDEIPSEASVSFAFSAEDQQDFRQVRKRTGPS